MSNALPLGQRESSTLEFKSRASLDKPASIGRAVVAMLNTGRGIIWVGVGEEGGMASSLERIERVDDAQKALWNHIVDTLEPSPLASEVRMEPVALSETGGEAVLRISVDGSEERRPYAQITKNGRVYWIRVEERTRVMSREELLQAFQRAARVVSPIDEVLERMLQQRDEIRPGRPALSVRTQPIPDVEVAVESPEVTRLLTEPKFSGNRSIGWHAIRPQCQVQTRQGARYTEIPGVCRMEVRRDGGLALEVALEALQASRGQDREFNPYALIEFPTSVLRMAKALVESASLQVTGIAADLALFGVQGWLLKPWSPESWGAVLREHRGTQYGKDDFLLDRPLVFAREDVLDNPDGCSYRLMRLVYEAFEFGEDMIPFEFDHETKRLNLPSL